MEGKEGNKRQVEERESTEERKKETPEGEEEKELTYKKLKDAWEELQK